MVVVAQSRLVFQGLGSGSVLKIELLGWWLGRRVWEERSQG